MNVNEIRAAFIAHQVSHGHTQIARARLVPEGDGSTLFTGSGMQQLLPYLNGQDHPAGTRLTDVQPCLRSQDIDDVGDNRHTTFFEMLGNWSLGDYFKAEQTRQFFSFLVDTVGLDPHKIFVTAFMGDESVGVPQDSEVAQLWQTLFAERGIEAGTAVMGSQADGDVRGVREGERIFFYDSSENWWSRGGGPRETPLGDPCGPDSEMFYDFGEEHQDPTFGLSHPASDGGRFMEIGNQVFMQFRRELDGSFAPLDKRNVDFGGGLERIAAAAIDTPDVFRISTLRPLVEVLEQQSGVSYDETPVPLRIIADHLRGSVFLAVDGITPSNKEQGYVMRRLIRRAIRTALGIGLNEGFVEPIVQLVIEEYREAYPELADRGEEVLAIILAEEKKFRRTLQGGLRALNKLAETGLTGADVFLLSDTFGFPKELTIEEANRLEITIDPQWAEDFDAQMQAQRERSRGSSKLSATPTA